MKRRPGSGVNSFQGPSAPFRRRGEAHHDLRLDGVRVLELVHDERPVLRVEMLSRGSGVSKQVAGLEEEVVEVEQPVSPLGGFDLREEGGADLCNEGCQLRDEGESVESGGEELRCLGSGLEALLSVFLESEAAATAEIEFRLKAKTAEVLEVRRLPRGQLFQRASNLVGLRVGLKLRREEAEHLLPFLSKNPDLFPDLLERIFREDRIGERQALLIEVECEGLEPFGGDAQSKDVRDGAGVAARGPVEPVSPRLVGEVRREQLVSGDEVGIDAGFDGPLA